MKETIASRCLAVAKQNEEKRLDRIKDSVLELIKKRFRNLLEKGENWLTDGYTYDINKLCEELDASIIEVFFAFQSLGFFIQNFWDKITISIPEVVKSSGETVAQTMLKEHRKELESRKQAYVNLAKGYWEKVIKYLENTEPSHLKTSQYDETTYCIELPVKSFSFDNKWSKKIFDVRLQTIAQQNGFCKCYRYDTKIELYVAE